MNILNAIILGIIQGLTEFLPISSSGHLVLYQYFFGDAASNAADISLEIFLHLGSLFAVIIYFRRELLDLVNSLFHWKKTFDANKHFRNRMVIVYLIISTIFTGIVYLLFGKEIVSVFAKPLTVSILLIITGVIIFLSDLVKTTDIPMSGMGLIRSALIGLGQGFAMLPGISRSGTTIATSLFCGIKRKDAAKYSFLLSIPAILAANLGEFKSFTELQSGLLLQYIFGALAAFVSGYLVISLLIRLIQSAKLKYFAFYCWFIAAVSIILIILA
ncbi:MAG: undecaprenyl-diphosphate phosphatase [Candidatus Cloacimonadaceae bacterium]